MPEALSNTLLIAERCNVDLSFKGYHLPEFPVPEGYTAETYLRHLCEEGADKRYGDRATSPEVRQRLDYELGVVHKMGFDAYFLIVSDLCQHRARNRHLVQRARLGGRFHRCLRAGDHDGRSARSMTCSSNAS